jgi:hypothetical protein
LQHCPKRITDDDGIGVKQQDKLSRTNLKSLIICRRESNILLIANHLDIGKLLRNHISRAIDRCIIDHNDLERNTVCCLVDRVQTSYQEFLNIPTYNDDREVCSRHSGLFQFALENQ